MKELMGDKHRRLLIAMLCLISCGPVGPVWMAGYAEKYQNLYGDDADYEQDIG